MKLRAKTKSLSGRKQRGLRSGHQLRSPGFGRMKQVSLRLLL